jgi:hypothetical protein
MRARIVDPKESEQINVEFEKLAKLGVIEYILPTKPLGDAWVVGLKEGGLLKLDSNESAMIYLAGVNVATMFIARKQGILA